MNIAKLRGKFAGCNLPLYKGAQCLGISERTFYSKIQICELCCEVKRQSKRRCAKVGTDGKR